MEIGNINNVNPVNIPDQADSNKPVKQSGVENQNIENQNIESQQGLELSGKNKKKNEDNIGNAVDKLNKAAAVFDRSLKFQVHEKTHQTVVSVIDTATKKVIRQIPSKEALDMVSKMEDYLGLIFDKKA